MVLNRFNLYLRDIMYNSGEVFLPQTVKHVLETNFVKWYDYWIYIFIF